MNVLFFLTPKQDVAFLYSDCTLRQALEKMEHHRYSCIPIIDRDGVYVGSITEGDLLWDMKHRLPIHPDSFEGIPLSRVSRRLDYRPVFVTTTIQELLGTSIHQNFVPVVDSRNVFIGIVTRKSIMQYCVDRLQPKE